MERRFDELLTARLEDALLNGCTHITWSEVYHWYGIERLAAGTERDLNNRWLELTQKKRGRLMMVRGRDGMFLFGEKDSRPVYKE